MDEPPLLTFLDPATGKSMIQGKKITSFTTQAEGMGIMDGLWSWKESLIYEHAKTLGAEYKSSCTIKFSDECSVARGSGQLPACVMIMFS